ncbi:uncharacterized protein MONOS_5876 [Monocercomonoides exilis]|uniref:uncharacterized protein n=1 Tax=Monocercomonoides exilis TaxID=2049356 RepID=UPI00355AC13D|nr:hypothetical protein MONOS_5876 [Monocercomonoides exilis]|eukprot:MONOS_5876.1-p1 / transcript=MONOS_5876.1 / gene=MONOS_5876 / organism=Monocercomonoides_exilis_PA203 / gene_product=unspecified product / transcript_product=unspecified product / location=Mono_scaffold00176:98768-100519(+) / protein_length=583 / sequence_SO=supercontig / SO=protein_coding / is_pseudo=false
MDEFNERWNICEKFENLVFFFGKCQVGKSPLINRLRGMEMEEDEKGKLVAKTRLEKTAKMGDEIKAETVLPEAYDLNDKITLLDTRGFLGEEIDIAEDVLSSLILQFHHKYATKVMIIYITEFENYSSLTKAYADMEILNKKCNKKDIPILFLTNKCKEYQIMQKKNFKNMKENYQSEDTHEDAKMITKEAQDLLIKKIRKLEKDTIGKIVKKFSEISKDMTLEQIIETLLRKEKGATGKEAEEVRIGLKEMQIIYLWDKAITEGRLLYYDPTLACSVERIIEKIEDLNNYRDPCDVNLEFNSKYYNSFIDSITTMANKYYWLVLAMRGRQRITNILKDVANTCEILASETSKLCKDIYVDVLEIDVSFRKMNFQPIDLLKINVKTEKVAIKRCDDEMRKYQEMISELDKDEPIIYETIIFYEHSCFLTNECRIYKKINVPKAMAKFIPGNEYTFNDETDKLCIKDGKLQGTFRAPRTGHRVANDILRYATFDIASMFYNETSVCKGTIELSAPMRDIPSNVQKIKECRIKMNLCEKQKNEYINNLFFNYEEVIDRLINNKEKEDEIQEKEKEKREKKKKIEK